MKKVKSTRLGSGLRSNLVNKYCIVFGAVAFVYLLIGYLSGGETIFSSFFFTIYKGQGSTDLFMDFFNSVRDASQRDVYDTGVIYPPIVNLFYYIVSKFMDTELLDTPFSRRLELRNNDLTGLLIYFLITFIALLLIYKVIEKYLQQYLGESKGSIFIFVLTTLFSYPVVYCVQRGNILIFAFLFTLVFVLFRNSESGVMRELAYISLALAAGIKIYPAVFGILLLYDRKYKDTVRLVLYGIVVFFLPFVFYGGLDGLEALYENITDFSGDKSVHFYLGNCSVYNLCALIGFPFPSSVFCFTQALAVVMLIVFKRTTQRLITLCYLLLNVQSIGEPYMLMFLIIPFVMFIAKPEKLRKFDKIYFVIIALMLLPLPCLWYSAIEPMAEFVFSFSLNIGIRMTNNLAYSLLISVNKVMEMLLVQITFIILAVDFVKLFFTHPNKKAIPVLPEKEKEKSTEKAAQI